MFIIRWRNRYSGEMGFVKSISIKEGHFNNTFDIKDAQKYKTQNSVSCALTNLAKMGETMNNDFEVMSV